MIKDDKQLVCSVGLQSLYSPLWLGYSAIKYLCIMSTKQYYSYTRQTKHLFLNVWVGEHDVYEV